MEEIEAIGNNTKSTDENTRAVRDNNKAREKQLKLIGDINELLEEQNKKALKELDDIQKEEISQTEKHLKKLGYRVLRRNAMLPGGEVDLLCEAPDRRTIVLVEVKTRRVSAGEAGHAPPPEAAITRAKADKLIRLGERLKRANAWADRPLRIDVVAVELAANAKPVIRHHENAVGR